MDMITEFLGLGLDPKDLTLGQMAARTLVVFVWSLFLLHIVNQRVIGRNSGSDVMLLVVLGSVLSRAVNGAAAFFSTLGVCVLSRHFVACRDDSEVARVSRPVSVHHGSGDPCYFGYGFAALGTVVFAPPPPHRRCVQIS